MRLQPSRLSFLRHLSALINHREKHLAIRVLNLNESYLDLKGAHSLLKSFGKIAVFVRSLLALRARKSLILRYPTPPEVN